MYTRFHLIPYRICAAVSVPMNKQLGRLSLWRYDKRKKKKREGGGRRSGGAGRRTGHGLGERFGHRPMPICAVRGYLFGIRIRKNYCRVRIWSNCIASELARRSWDPGTKSRLIFALWFPKVGVQIGPLGLGLPEGLLLVLGVWVWVGFWANS